NWPRTSCSGRRRELPGQRSGLAYPSAAPAVAPAAVRVDRAVQRRRLRRGFTAQVGGERGHAALIHALCLGVVSARREHTHQATVGDFAQRLQVEDLIVEWPGAFDVAQLQFELGEPLEAGKVPAAQRLAA